MKKIFNILSVWVISCAFMQLSAQCPTLFDLKVDGNSNATICAPDNVNLSVYGTQLPSKGEIGWYYSEDPGFNPRTEGTLIGKTQLPEHLQQKCPVVCPDLLMIMMNSCDKDGLGVGDEHDNEFFIFTSGSGFFASDVQFKINEGTNDVGNTNRSINIGTNACQIKKPSDALMTKLRKGACSNLNLFPAGPGDFVPADALVIFYMSSNVAMDYDLTTLCASGKSVYVMQNACQRTIGAFTNSTTSNNSYRENFLSLKDCAKCTDSLNYNRNGMRDKEGEYIIDKDFQYASVANGSILLNDSINPCQTPDLGNYFKAEPYTMNFTVAANSPLCGKTVYFKAYVTPSDEAICASIVASGASLNVNCTGSSLQVDAPESVCSGNPLEIKLGSAGNYTWTVNAPAGVSGLSGGSGNVSVITQTPVYSGSTQVDVIYTISSASTTCTSTPVTVAVKIGPALSATISGNTTICGGSKTTLTVNAGNNTVLWNTGATTNSIEVSEAGTYSVKIGNGICEANTSVEVQYIEGTTATITGDINICNDESTILTVNESFDSYVWSTGANTSSITVNEAGAYTVTVTKGECTNTAAVTVKNAAILVTLPNKVSITKGQSITLQPNIAGIEEGENVTYSWSPSEGLSCTDCAAPVTTSDETKEYILSVTNEHGCTDSDTILVEVLAEKIVYLPNAFSPNGDGKNDILYVRSNINDVKLKILEIYNRWGESVFRAEDVMVNDPAAGWNGYYKNKLSGVDSYSFYYEVEFPDATLKRDKGTILIVR